MRLAFNSTQYINHSTNMSQSIIAWCDSNGKCPSRDCDMIISRLRLSVLGRNIEMPDQSSQRNPHFHQGKTIIRYNSKCANTAFQHNFVVHVEMESMLLWNKFPH